MTVGGGVVNCWAKKHKSVALLSWESELFSVVTSGPRSARIYSDLKDLGFSCSVSVATDSQSVIDHSRRMGHSVASTDVGLRGLCLQEALVDKKLELEKVHTAMNPADVCIKELLGDRIRRPCEAMLRTAHCRNWVNRAVASTRSRHARLSLKGRVEFMCLSFGSQLHLTGVSGHELVGPNREGCFNVVNSNWTGQLRN